jgi:hypothetical protein
MPDARQIHAPHVARQEVRQFLQMAERLGMDTDGQCQWLDLSREDWQRWVGILHDAPLPSYPALPLLLRRLGFVSSRLDRAERTAYA